MHYCRYCYVCCFHVFKNIIGDVIVTNTSLTIVMIAIIEIAITAIIMIPITTMLRPLRTQHSTRSGK